MNNSAIQKQLVGATEKFTEKRANGIEVTFERFLVSFENNECKKSDLNTLMANTLKDTYSTTHKDK